MRHVSGKSFREKSNTSYSVAFFPKILQFMG